MQKKKETRAEIERRMKNALVLVPRTKDAKMVFFSDRGLRLTHTEDYTIIETGYHRHVFDNVTAAGLSRVSIYIERVIDIAYENDCVVNDINTGKYYSFAKLIDVLKEKDDKTEFNIVTYVSWYLFNIFTPLYQLSEDSSSMFLVYLNYIHNITSQSIFLEEHKDGLTNIQFIEKYKDVFNEITEGIEESQIFRPLSDEELLKQEVDSLNETDFEQNISENADGTGEN